MLSVETPFQQHQPWPDSRKPRSDADLFMQCTVSDTVVPCVACAPQLNQRGKQKKKKKQVDIDHTRKSIGHCHWPGQVEGEQRGSKWREDKK
jgi:hypothetical protein